LRLTWRAIADGLTQRLGRSHGDVLALAEDRVSGSE